MQSRKFSTKALLPVTHNKTYWHRDFSRALECSVRLIVLWRRAFRRLFWSVFMTFGKRGTAVYCCVRTTYCFLPAWNSDTTIAGAPPDVRSFRVIDGSGFTTSSSATNGRLLTRLPVVMKHLHLLRPRVILYQVVCFSVDARDARCSID